MYVSNESLFNIQYRNIVNVSVSVDVKVLFVLGFSMIIRWRSGVERD
jgi:hypothetical protein